MKIVRVPGFDKIPDGRIRIGPVQLDMDDIPDAFREYGLRISEQDDLIVHASPHAQGIVLSCAGPGVHGYILSEDGFEADIDDLKMLMRDLVAPGMSCRIEGHYRISEDEMIESKSYISLSDDGRNVMYSSLRERVTKCGARKPITQESTWSHGAPEGVFSCI